MKKEESTKDTENKSTKKQGKAIENPVAEEAPAQEEKANPKATQDELTQLQEKYDNLNDKYLRLYSEYENFRRRTAKERLEIMENSGARILEAFLPVVDDFDRAIASNDSDTDLENVKEGFKLIHNKLLRTLEANGVKPMNAMEEAFDTNFHEAITNIPAPEESLKGKVLDVAEKGYFYNDKVLRYAKVVVGQ